MECFGLGQEPDLVTCFVLATECLTMNVACDCDQLVCSFPCIMLMQSFVFPFGIKGILSSWKLNESEFSVLMEIPS